VIHTRGLPIGLKYHSWQYKTPQDYQDKNVLIIGIGNSGGDMAVELSRIAKQVDRASSASIRLLAQVYLSTRRGTWVLNRVGPNGWPADMLMINEMLALIQRYFPRLINRFLEYEMNKRFDHQTYGLKPNNRPLGEFSTDELPLPMIIIDQHPFINDDLANRVLCGSIMIKPNVKEFTDDGHGVLFEDGSRVEQIDCVLMATGFDVTFPYLDEQILAVRDNHVRYTLRTRAWRDLFSRFDCINMFGLHI
jgi:dimethylaniline monooxygenase (N-oxide forming)